jgi:HSP20 family protein
MAKTEKKTAKKPAPAGQQAASAQPGSAAPAKAGKPAAAAAPTPFQDLERVFEDFLSRRWPRPLGWDWPRWDELTTRLEGQVPSLDIVDGEKEVVVRAALPGVEKKDIDVSIVERTLTIKGSTRKE